MFCVLACVEDYSIDAINYENLLVVDGRITTDPPPYTIRLSRSSNIDAYVVNPEKGAIVTIMDQVGNLELLREVEDGVYKSSSNGMHGSIGNSYQVKIVTADNKKTYRSNFEPILDSLSITNVEVENETIVSDENFIALDGYRFHLHNNLSIRDTNYYFIDLEETYQYHADFVAGYKFIGHIEKNEEPYKYYTCWRTRKVNELFVYDNDYHIGGDFDIPLNFIKKGLISSVKYSFLLHHHTISQSAYTYFGQVKSLIGKASNIYAIQGYPVIGNMKNVEDPSETVLGYFYASSVTQKRYFFDFSDASFSLGCVIDFEAMRFLRFEPYSEYPIPLVQDPTTGKIGRAFGVCIDCRAAGGTIIKPDFWED